ncbi:unnamed protein product [Cylindrotheca closterium]|uniref:Uncharacterized protein n=1 Tax=Cylindrotheca closterium TaxID=2856 RepID=A0AAD2JH83_9STRA|nr:unnamed protein product [Cylindrotheca closterium]
MTSGDEPYSAIADIFNKAFQKVKGAQRLESISSAIRNDFVRDELQLLSHLIPSLKDILGGSSTTTEPVVTLDYDELENGLERLKYAFRALTRVFCAKRFPQSFSSWMTCIGQTYRHFK